MSEYVRRIAGGFYIIDDVPGSRVLSVRRAVHQVLDPKTGHPFPEIPLEEQLARQLWDQWEPVDYSNELVPNLELSEESVTRTVAALIENINAGRPA